MSNELFTPFRWRNFLDSVLGGGQANDSLWRGQECPDWGLVAGFDRELARVHKQSVNDREAKFNKRLAEYKRLTAALNTKDESSPRSSIVNLELSGQHQGLRTRLLDWSESPFVAVFFAFARFVEQGFGSESIRQVLHRQSDRCVAVWQLMRTEELPETIKVIRDYPSSGYRQRAQLGAFTRIVGGTTVDLSVALPVVIKDNGLGSAPKIPLGSCLVKWQLLASDFAVAFDDLRSMGINYSLLFPDEYGAAMQVNLTQGISNLAGITRIRDKIESDEALLRRIAEIVPECTKKPGDAECDEL